MLFRRTPSIAPRQAAEHLAAGEYLLVDVREPDELRADGAVEGARNIPLGQLPTRLGELDRSRPVAFICRSGGRSAQATRAAIEAGHSAVNVTGGVEAWARAGLPLVRKESA